MATKSYYDTLGVSETATPEKIREEYLVRSKMFHPDRFDPTRQASEWRLANEMLKDLNQAYSVLRDSRARSAYDATLRSRQHAPPPPQPTQQSHQASPPPPPPQPERRQPPRNLGVLSSGFAVFSDLPQAIRERLLRRVSGQNKQQFMMSVNGVGWNYFFLLILPAWYVLLFVFATNQRWTNDGTLFAFGGSAVTAIFAGINLGWIIRWHRSPLRCKFIVSPLYFIKTHLDQVWFWPIWKLQDLSATHNYRNGMYQGTNVRFVFDNATEHFVFKDRNAFENAASALKAFDAKVRSAKQYEEYEYFVEEDDFREWNMARPPKPKGAASFTTILTTVSALVLATVATLAAVIVNNVTFPYEPPSRFASQQPVASAGTAPTPVRTAPAPAAPPRPVFSQPQQYMPPSGEVRRYTTQDGVAPLEIRSTAGENYLVKLDNPSTGRPVLSVFVRGGQTEKVLVPVGSYVVKYASGDQWYGYSYLFGPDTRYSKAEEKFDFTYDGRQYSGYTVTLYKVKNGNLHTLPISAKDF